MKIDYKRIPLRPYPGEILLFDKIDFMRAKYVALTGSEWTYAPEKNGGQYIVVEGKRDSSELLYLMYGKKPHVLAHEFSHVLLDLFDRCGIHPKDGNGEPFCYMLSQLMLDAR